MENTNIPLTNQNGGSLPEPAKSKRALYLTIYALSAVLFIALGAGGYWAIDSLYNEDEEQNTESTEQNTQDETPVVEDTNDNAQNDTDEETKETPTKVCDIGTLGFSSKIYTDWKCEKLNGGLTITGDNFTISIHDGARGLYCGGDPSTYDTCKTETFYENSEIKMTSFSLDKKLGEIYGTYRTIQTENIVSFSITYKDKTIADLTSEQEAQLKGFLETVEID